MEHFNENQKSKHCSVLEYSPLTFAFLGDAIHTLFVRQKLIDQSNLSINSYHKLASKHCNAVAQAMFLDSLTPILTQEENEVIRRARNAKLHHGAKSADEETYKKATCFEALLGYLKMTDQTKRLTYILNLEEF